MTTILVTGTSGHLGRLVVESLLENGTSPGDIVATARDISAIADLADRGVTTRTADYADPASLDAAFDGVDRVLLVSGSEVGQRVAQHTNVIDAAQRAGVELLAYTSIPKADTSSLGLAVEHQATEQVLAASGVPYALLRNSWYFENYTAQIPVQLEHGVVLGAAGDGKVSGASRGDYAAAAAAVLVADDQAGRTYELGGEPAFTLAEYAAALAAASGSPVTYQDLTPSDYAAALASNGVPQQFADLLADSDRGIAAGELFVDSGDLTKLIGRPTATLAAAVAAALPA